MGVIIGIITIIVAIYKVVKREHSFVRRIDCHAHIDSTNKHLTQIQDDIMDIKSNVSKTNGFLEGLKEAGVFKP